jgi:serine/threonine protein kinase
MWDMILTNTAGKVCNDVLAALKEAHGVGIVHGDIRPANVIALHSDATETTFMLIDWGSGHALRTASVPKQKGPISHPENAQFKKGATGRFEDVDVRSKLGDLLSVLYLYCAIMYANDTSTLLAPPWHSRSKLTYGMHLHRGMTLEALADRDTFVALFLAAPTYVWPEGVVLTSLPELPTAKSRMPASAPTALPATSLFVRRQNPRG